MSLGVKRGLVQKEGSPMAFTEDQRGSLYFPQFPFIPLWTFPLLPPLFSLFLSPPPSSSDPPFPCELWTPKIIHPRSSFLCPLRRTSVREGGRLPLRRRQAASDRRTRNRRNKTKKRRTIPLLKATRMVQFIFPTTTFFFLVR